MANRIGVRFALAFLSVCALFATATVPAEARLLRPNAVHRPVRFSPVTPGTEKDAAMVVDGATGRVLYSRNPDEIRYPASLTKMMTLYLLFEAVQKGQVTLDTPLIASVHASQQEPTKVGIKPGETIDVETAIKAITVLSANDVAVVIAESLGVSEANFAKMMTAKAHELGMLRTNFDNASGLPDPLQLTTASDMAILGRHIAYDFPKFYTYFSAPGFTFDKRTYLSHDNLLVAFPGTDGIKTGYTRDSGFNLVTSAVRGNKHIVGVVLGGLSAGARDHEMIRLLTAAFDYADKNPTQVADANAPWLGGKGPGFDPFKVPVTGEANVLNAVLDAPVIQTAPQVLVASAKAPGTTAPTGTNVVNGVITNGRTQLVSLRARVLKAVGVKSNLPPELSASADEAPTSQGDVEGVSMPAAPANVSAVKHWVVQIGAFATQTLAQAQLAAYAKQALDVLGRAQRLVVPFASVDGHTVYRARFGLFAENEARDICKRISLRGATCFATAVN